MLGFLKKLAGGGGQKPPQHAAELDYQGFHVVATPVKGANGWSTQGTIEKTIDGEPKRVAFVRADTSPSVDSAAEMSLDKAKKIIDERGDAVFDSDRA